MAQPDVYKLARTRGYGTGVDEVACPRTNGRWACYDCHRQPDCRPHASALEDAKLLGIPVDEVITGHSNAQRDFTQR